MAHPEHFYKYVDADTVKIILKNRTLRWSAPSRFNDPFDVQFDLHTKYDRGNIVQEALNEMWAIYNQKKEIVAANALGAALKSLSSKSPLFSWDNYLSIYLELFGENLSSCDFATHEVGDKPNLPFYKHDVWDVPQNLDYWLSSQAAPWIMNIDIDYFFCDDADDNSPQQFLSDAFIGRCFDVVNEKLHDGTIRVLTIALTATKELTGGWLPAEQVAKKGMSKLGIDFKLPRVLGVRSG